MWDIVRSQAKSAQELMSLDQFFLETLTRPTLHFYRFKGPSLTYGVLMKPQEHLNLVALEEGGVSYAKRPTGGGALFHLWDLAFSVIIPLTAIAHIKGTLERYLCLNQLTQKGIEPFLSASKTQELLQQAPKELLGERFCMARPTQYDVMIGGKKCVGAAQRVGKNNLLHQSSISLCAPDLRFLGQVLLDQKIVLSMAQTSFYLYDFCYQESEKLMRAQNDLEASLEEVFQTHELNLFQR